MSTDLVPAAGADIATVTDLPPAPQLPVGVAPKPIQSGKIRVGEKDADRGFPKSIPFFRLTNPAKEVIDAAAQAYGGEVTKWDDPMARPPSQWQVTTTTNSMDVIVATSGAFSIFYESWTAGGVAMRTDGRVNLITGEVLRDPCPVSADPREQERLAKEWADKHGLKLTARVTVMPLDLPGLSEWLFETHGWITTAMLAETAQKLAHFAAAGVSHVQARLVLTPSQGQVPVRGERAIEKAKKAPKSHGYRQMADGSWVQKSNFVLVTLEIVTQTPRQMFAIAQATATRVAELAAEEVRLELEQEAASQKSMARSAHAKRTFDPTDPFPLDDGPSAEMVSRMEAGRRIISALQAQGLDEATAMSRGRDEWQAAGLPARGDVPVAALTALLAKLAATGPGSDDEIADAELVEDQGPYAIDGEEAGQ